MRLFSSEFSEPLPVELETIRQALHREHGAVDEKWLSKIKIGYEIQDNFTYAAICDGEYVQFGIAKRNPKDLDKPEIALRLSLWRAANALPFRLPRPKKVSKKKTAKPKPKA